MEQWDDLKPDMKFLKFRLEAFRLFVARQQNPSPNHLQQRMELELELLQLQTQEKLIGTMERSIESQDRFSKNANFLAWGAFVLAAVEIVVTVFF